MRMSTAVVLALFIAEGGSAAIHAQSDPVLARVREERDTLIETMRELEFIRSDS